MLCSITAISPDGKRSTIEIEASSVNRAAILYHYRAVGNAQGLIVPDRETLFEIKAAGKTYRTNWSRVLDWANREAAKSLRKSKR